MRTGTGVPLFATGVFAFDSVAPLELEAAMGWVFIGDDSFDSSLTGSTGPNGRRAWGETFRVMIMAFEEDFLRAPAVAAGLGVVDAIVRM